MCRIIRWSGIIRLAVNALKYCTCDAGDNPVVQSSVTPSPGERPALRCRLGTVTGQRNTLPTQEFTYKNTRFPPALIMAAHIQVKD